MKRVHAGKAARGDGELGRACSTWGDGSTDVLEAEKGYFRAFASGDWNADALLGGLGERWDMLGTYMKPYPCCRHLHGPIDAVLALAREQDLSMTGVRRVTVETYEVAAHHAGKRVLNVLDAQMSIPYAVAVALRDREVGLSQFSTGSRTDPEVASLLERVRSSRTPLFRRTIQRSESLR